MDCKKKELIGNYKNSGTEWELKKNAPQVKVYDFVDKELGKAVPYGVYDITRNEHGDYAGIVEDSMWTGWQARAAPNKPEEAKS